MMNTQAQVKMDRELVQAVRDAIAADVESFEMAYWFNGPGTTEWRLVAKALEGGCGTTACLAGHAVVQYAKLHNTKWEIFGDEVRADGRRRESVSVVASRVLSASDGDVSPFGPQAAWRELFTKGEWPAHYWDMMRESALDRDAQAKAAIELLDDILDGITVWREESARCCSLGCRLCEKMSVIRWVYLPDEVPAEA